MIFGWIRLAFFALLGLTVVYVLLRIYARSLHREKLEKRWASGAISGELKGDREAWIEAGMQSFERSLLRKLLWLVYILPMVAMGVTIYLVNW